MDFTVSAPGNIPAGTLVTDPDGKVHFEVGQGMNDSFPMPVLFAVDNARNVLHPHIWDENDTCLPIGSTELYIDGHHTADLPLDDTPPDKPPGKWLLLQTFPTNPEVQARAFMVRLIARQDTNDPVLLQPLTHLQWEDTQATPFELDLETLEVHGNLLRATSGRTISQRFTIGPSSDENDRPSAIERAGPDGSTAYMFSLPGSDQSQLVWLGPKPETAAPEMRLTSRIFLFGTWMIVDEWKWTRALLGAVSAQPNDLMFTLDDGFWREVVKYQRIGNDIVHRDYATGLGLTVRFGDGQFGAEPAVGTVFEADFRLDGGLKSNVAAGTLTRCPMGGIVQRVTNPLLAINGVDPEPPQDIRHFASEAFRAVTFRAGRPEDYAEAAERLPWVLRAGCAFRWTGSWIDAFVTPDARGSFTVTAPERLELERQIDRFRQAGRPAYVLDPRYANIDLIIAVCVEASSFSGEVKKRVLEALFGHGGIRPTAGFFSHDNFTFGTPLERSRLEAAIQEVSGVRAVEEIQFRRRGWFDWRVFSELTYRVGDNELIRVENDPNLSERGSVTLDMRGGA
jgi:hypothetical protein